MSTKSGLRILGNWSVERLRRWKDNIKIDVREIRCGDWRWMEHALVLAVLNLQILY
jgi:hypothetical protein